MMQAGTTTVREIRRIVVRTSTIPQEITMTTEISLAIAVDAFTDNDIVLLERSAFPDGLQLAALEWSARGNASLDAFQRVLDFVLTLLANCMNDYDIWLLTGDSVWQPDTRVVRYRKRFNALKMRGIDFESVPERFESAIEQDGKIKFYGAVRLDRSLASAVSLVTAPGSSAFVVAKPKSSSIEFLLASGWSGKLNADSRMVADVVAIGGIVLQRFGFFDDARAGIIAIGGPDVLQRVVSEF